MEVNMNELLEQYKSVTQNMTQEKYNYLKKHEWLSPVKKVRLAILKKNGASEELLIRAEFAYLFENYANHYYKWYKANEWDKDENEGLFEFADGALNQAVREEIENNSIRHI